MAHPDEKPPAFDGDQSPSYAPDKKGPLPEVEHSAPSTSQDASLPAYTPLALPIILPPLYPPSPSSPFLLAAPDAASLPHNVHPSAVVALVRALNEALQPSTGVKIARSTEHVVGAVPIIGPTYHLVKGILVGGSLSIAQVGATVAGGKKGKAAQGIKGVHETIFGTSVDIPPAAASLLAKANSEAGLFPPSSTHRIALVPHSALAPVLDQHRRAFLPRPQERVLAGLQAAREREGSAPAALKKAMTVRQRVDFRMWSYLELEGEATTSSSSSSSILASSSAPSDSKGKGRASPSSSSSSPSLFAHLDHKLNAREQRRGRTPDAILRQEVVRDETGYKLDDPMSVKPETLFLVVVEKRVKLE